VLQTWGKINSGVMFDSVTRLGSLFTSKNDFLQLANPRAPAMIAGIKYLVIDFISIVFDVD
jgi:hypothetical protein